MTALVAGLTFVSSEAVTLISRLTLVTLLAVGRAIALVPGLTLVAGLARETRDGCSSCKHESEKKLYHWMLTPLLAVATVVRIQAPVHWGILPGSGLWRGKSQRIKSVPPWLAGQPMRPPQRDGRDSLEGWWPRLESNQRHAV
jgi:hypothetical protein